jgi:hypothetical protein
VFVCGMSADDNVNRMLQYEHLLFDDIVQADFQDTYFNLTLKSILTFRWAARFHANSKYLLKIDDDIVPNIFKLANYFEIFHQQYSQNASLHDRFHCYIYHNGTVFRDSKTSKFAMSKSEYKADFYPDYCGGGAYMASMAMARRIAELRIYDDYVKFEDVYITGHLRLLFSWKFVKQNHMHKFDPINFNQQQQHKSYVPNLNRFLFFYCSKDQQAFIRTWNYILKCFDHHQ